MTSISISISSVLIVTSVVPQMKTILFLFLLAFALVLIFRLAQFRFFFRLWITKEITSKLCIESVIVASTTGIYK